MLLGSPYTTYFSYCSNLKAAPNGSKFAILDGINENIVSGSEATVWPEGGLNAFPTAASLLKISSSEVADTAPSGVGAHKIDIIGVDASFKEITDTVDLDGENDVFSQKNFLAVNGAQVSGVGSAFVNQGTITIEQSIGGMVLGEIMPKIGLMSQILFTVPLGFEAHIIYVDYTSISAMGMANSIVFYQGKTFDLTTRILLTPFRRKVNTTLPNNPVLEQPVSDPHPPGTVIFLTASTDGNNVEVYATMYIVLERV